MEIMSWGIARIGAGSSVSPCGTVYLGMSLSSRLLHANEVVHVRHVRCRPHDHVCGAVETANSNTVAFPLRGIFVKHLDDGREVVAHTGQAVFFNASESYRVSHPFGGDDCFVLDPSKLVLHEILDTFCPYANKNAPLPFRASHTPLPAPALLQQRLLWKSLRETSGALEIEERALELITTVLSTAQVNPPPRERVRAATLRRRREQLRATSILLANNPASRWTLAVLARHVHSSPFHLARAFRNEQGLPIHRYLLHVRLAHALDAVLDTNSSLTAIALEAGFSTPSHFTSAFRAHFGATPSNLRRSVRAETARKLRKISTAPIAD